MTLALRWLGCAGFRITAGEESLLIDPWISRNPFASPPHVAQLADLVPAEAILLSHGHFDHAADVPALVKLAPLPIHTTARGAKNLARAGVDPRLVQEIAPGWRAQIGPFAVQAEAVTHVHYGLPLVLTTLRRLGWRAPSYLPLLTDWPCGQPVAFRIDVAGTSIVHMGTAGATAAELDQVARGGPIDILLVALQGNARIHEIAARIVARLTPKLVIPHHQDDFYPPVSMSVPVGPFEDLVLRTAPATRVQVLAVGETYAVPEARPKVA